MTKQANRFDKYQSLVSGTKIPALKHGSGITLFLTLFYTVAFLTGDIKRELIALWYCISNFEPTGLGKNQRLGWVCNGQETELQLEMAGISMPYGDSYLTMRSQEGSADATLPLRFSYL
jgi:hypothetical protein